MPRPALRVKVSQQDQAALKKILTAGVEQVRVTLRAVALQRLGEGMSAPQIAAVLPMTRQTVRNLARRYQQGGLEGALYDQQRPGAARLLSAQQCQRIIAMVSSDPPPGRARWTVRLVAAEAVRRGLVPRAGRETIRVLLLSHDLKPWREKNVVRGGTANVFCAVEPKAGRHFTFVTPNRSGVEFAKALWEVARAYPDAETIHLVMDNLSTHSRKSLTDLYGQQRGGRLWDCFTPHYTPLHGSWLNQAEIEIGLFSRPCLGRRRIPELVALRREAAAWNRRVNRERVKINWRFDRKAARRKFSYEKPSVRRSEN